MKTKNIFGEIMNIKFVSLFLVVLMVSPSIAQKTLTLDDAISIALKRNSNLQKSEFSISGYESNLMTSYGGLLPSLSASTGWNWSRTEDEGGPTSVGNTVINTPKTTTETRNYSGRVSSNWVLFDGLSNFASISKSNKELESAKLNLMRLKQDIVFQTMSNYYTILNLEKLVKVKEENLKWNQKNFEIIKEKSKLGSGTMADVYAQQVKLGNAELELIQAQNDYENEKSNFLYLLGLDVIEQYNIKDSEVSKSLDLIQDDETVLKEDLKVMIQKALENRPDFKSAAFKLDASYDNLTSARGSYFPSLVNSASFSVGGETPSEMFDRKQYSFGLTLQIPIFQGWSIDNRVQYAKIDVKNSEITLSDAEREIKKNIQKAYLDILAAEKKLDVSEKNVIAAGENLKIEEEKYSLGSTTLLNVLIANADYINAQTANINSQFNYLRLKDQINYLIGLTEYKKFEN